LALVTLGVVTVLVASEIFVESVQEATETFGMSQAFVVPCPQANAANWNALCRSRWAVHFPD
jgi:hypothetical protein